MYTIGQIASMFDMSTSTIRYYDKEKLIPNIPRKSGKRIFSTSEIEAIRVIECLKKSGLEIKDIKKYMDWCQQGNSSLNERKLLFEKQRYAIQREIKDLEKNLNMLEYKCWYYQEAVKLGEEKKVASKIPEKMPEPIKTFYNLAHHW